eukprot:gene46684-58209_t
MNLTVRQLRAFALGAQFASFSEAANRMGMTQPGYSLLIRQMEEEVGMALFRRTTRRVELTEAGREILQSAQRTLQQLDETRRRADAYLKGGYGGLVGFELAAGREAGRRFIDSLKLLYHVANIGDSRSLAIHPASTTHSQLTAEEQLATGVSDGYVRLSIGIEHIDDIIADLAQSRTDWTREEIAELFDLPFDELMWEAQGVHRRHHARGQVQLCTLLSIKTGGCVEDCGYCSQSASADSGLKAEKLMEVQAVLAAAAEAKASGSQRFCMGAAWRAPKDRDVDAVAELVRAVKEEGLEACATLGMLNEGHAETLRDAGLDYYNHNLDSAPDFYGEVITT